MNKPELVGEPELKLCPFCGGKAEARDIMGCHEKGMLHEYVPTLWVVECVDNDEVCGAQGHMSDSKPRAIWAWNCRADK